MAGGFRAGFLAAVMVAAAVAASAGVAQAAVAPCAPAWTAMPLPRPAGFDGGTYYNGISAVSPTDIWAAGNANGFGTPGTEAVLAHWNGASWKLTVPPHPAGEAQYDQLFSVSALPGGMAWAVGNSDAPANGGAIMDTLSGGTWSEGPGPALPFGSGTPRFAKFDAVAALSASDVWVEGQYQVGAALGSHAYAHWNGARWTIYHAAGEPGDFTEIRALRAISASSVWAVGDTETVGAGGGVTGSSTLIEHWNGTRWSVVPSPHPNLWDSLNAIFVVSPTNIFAAGDTSDGAAGANPHEALIVHWDGKTWTQMAGPTTGIGADVIALAGANGRDIWALGASASGTTYWAHSDGDTWKQLAAAAVTHSSTNEFIAATQTQGQLWAISANNDPPLAHRLCPAQLSDSGFTPASATIPVGSPPDWEAPKANTTSHTIADGSPFHLFTGTPLQPGYSQTPYRYRFAGSYPVVDAAAPSHTMTLGVIPVTDVSSFAKADGVQVVWGSGAMPSGFMVDVQVKKPGASSFTAWTTTNAPGARYTPAVAGSYQFRARLRRLSPAAALGWSPAVTVTAH